jgi:hypothetical protein
MREPVGRTFGRPGNHHPTVTVANQDHVAQILVLEDVDHVLYMRIEVDLGVGKVRAFSQAG